MTYSTTDREFPDPEVEDTLAGATVQDDTKINWVRLLEYGYLYHPEGAPHGSTRSR